MNRLSSPLPAKLRQYHFKEGNSRRKAFLSNNNSDDETRQQQTPERFLSKSCAPFYNQET